MAPVGAVAPWPTSHPPAIAVVRIELAPGDPSPETHPEEASLLQGASASRRRSFGAGRWCARSALEAIGARALPVGRDRRGAPVWPEGVVGAISHRGPLAAAAVSWRHDVAAVGLDIEHHRPLAPRVRRRLFASGPAAEVAGGDPGGLHLDAVAFSAKESAAKAWSALGRRPSLAGAVRLDPAAATLAVDLAGAPTLEGRFAVAGGFVHTLVWLAA